jgi:hypothetical protein
MQKLKLKLSTLFLFIPMVTALLFSGGYIALINGFALWLLSMIACKFKSITNLKLSKIK